MMRSKSRRVSSQRSTQHQAATRAGTRHPAVLAAVEAIEPRRLLTANIVVNTTADNVNDANVAGPTVTLRQAVNYADANGGAAITFDAAVFGASKQTVTLNPAYGELYATYGAPTTIAGPAVGVAVSGGDNVRVFHSNTQLELDNVTVTHGYTSGVGFVGEGAGVFVDYSGSLVANDCVFDANQADYFGSAIAATDGNFGNGSVTINDSSFTNNTATLGGVIYDTDRNGLTLSGDLFVNNQGGQNLIYASSTNTPLVVTNTTIVGNTTKYGLFYLYNTTATFTNDTIITTGSGTAGAGIDEQRSTIELDNNLFNTTGPALYNPDVTSTLQVTGSHNLIPDHTDGLPDTLTGKPLLGTLGDYGGPTQTVPLLPGSPAINSGAVLNGVTLDARGVSRSVGGAPDLGAFESHGFLIGTSGSGQATWIGKAFQTPLGVTVSSAYGEPVAGGQVVFSAPATGASAGTAAAPLSAPRTIAADGTAAASGVTANGIAGFYTVTANASGFTAPAKFNLGNIAVILGSPNLVYTGQPQAIGYTLSAAGLSPAVSYTTAGGVPLAAKPTDAGSYVLVLTLGGQTQSAAFTIAPATPTLTLSAAAGVFSGRPYAGLSSTVTGLGGTPLTTPAVTYSYYFRGDVNRTSPLPAPTEPGNYVAVANWSGNTNYVAASASQSFAIARATPTLTAVAPDAAYTGRTYVRPTATLLGVNGTPLGTSGVTYAYAAADGSALTGAPTDAGRYSVVARFGGDNEYAPVATAPAYFSITPVTPTVTVSAPGGDYTAGPFAASGSVDGLNGSIAVPDFTYFAADGTPLASAPVDAGTYTVVASYAGSRNYTAASASSVAFTINPIAPVLTLNAASGAYNGSAYAAAGTVDGLTGTIGSPAFAYFAADGTPLSGAPTDAGTYSVVAQFAGNQDYTAAVTAPAVFTISAIAPSVTASDAGGVYTGNAFAATGAVSGLNGAFATPTFTYATADGTPLDAAPTDAGTYSVVAHFAGNGNYTAADSAATVFAITAATPGVSVSAPGGVYNGSAFAATGTVTGVAGTIATPTFDYFAADGSPLSGAPTDAGTYSVVARYAGSRNYVAVDSAATPFTIAAATPTVTVNAAGGQYNGNAFTATGSVTGLSGTLGAPTLTYYAATNGVVGAALGGAPVDAGSYAVVAAYAGGPNYAAASSTPAFFTITQAAPVVGVAASGGTYNGAAFTATGTASGLGGTLGTPTITYYAANGTQPGAVLSGAPTNAGNYFAVATYAGSTDYTAASSTPVAFTVAKAQLTATAGNVTLTYGQPTPALTATLAGVVGGDAITAGGTSTSTGSAGVYAITPTLIDPSGKLANYSVTLVAGTLTINAASTTLALASSTNGISTSGQSVTFTATAASAAGTPGGSVQFFSNGVSLGSVALTGGVANLTTAALAVGSDAITAVYTPGDGNYVTSSAAMTQAVNAPVVIGGLTLLDRTGRGALSVSGNATVKVNGTITVDSSNSAAVVVSGSGSVQGTAVNIVGGESVTGGGKVAGAHTGQSAVSDPLASLAVPTTTGLTVRSTAALSIANSTVVTLQPGVYVGGIHISGAAKVTLAPGVYYLKGGGLSVDGAATLAGSGVLIYNAPTAKTDVMSFGGAANVTLSAMTGGTWAGVTLFQDRLSANAINISGSGTLKVTGTVYAAMATVSIAGAGMVTTFGTSVIVDDLFVSGSGELLV